MQQALNLDKFNQNTYTKEVSDDINNNVRIIDDDDLILVDEMAV